jgi:hypothetical protein
MAELVEYLPPPGGAARPFSVDEVVEWYEGRAPERLPVEMALTRDEPSPLRFRRQLVHLGPESGPGIATVQRLEIGPQARSFLAASDMTNGGVHLFSLPRGPLRIGEFGRPVHVEAGDLDGDGLEDLIVSDLGAPMPTDELVGRVVVALNAPDGNYAFRTTLDGVGRVADARPADLDGDGDLDVVAAAFGFLRSGGIYVLHNETPPGGSLEFRAHRIGDLYGAHRAEAPTSMATATSTSWPAASCPRSSCQSNRDRCAWIRSSGSSGRRTRGFRGRSRSIIPGTPARPWSI